MNKPKYLAAMIRRDAHPDSDESYTLVDLRPASRLDRLRLRLRQFRDRLGPKAKAPAPAVLISLAVTVPANVSRRAFDDKTIPTLLNTSSFTLISDAAVQRAAAQDPTHSSLIFDAFGLAGIDDSAWIEDEEDSAPLDR